MPTHLDTQQRATIKRKSRYFIILNDQLYKKNKVNPNRPIRVAKENEIEDILYHMHSDPLAGHFSIDEMYRRIKSSMMFAVMCELAMNANEGAKIAAMNLSIR
ncbi:unnamed protein product [Rhizophagus irregularis]|nr:unnamed protein product [Rhizophagus irregularis]